jgi:hypothetical protein
MIHLSEINKVAKDNRLKDLQIEKDYVLSWLLHGIQRMVFYQTILYLREELY